MVLLDTHILLWWASDPSRLSQRAAREIARAQSVLVSPVSCWEAATLVRLGRIQFERDVHTWIAGLLARERVAVAELRPAAATAAGLLDPRFPGDPADRLLYATARDLAVPLVSKDRRLRDWARAARDARVIW